MARKSSQPKTLLMVSGGPDSAVLAYLVAREQKEFADPAPIHAVYLRTGEPSDEREIESANRILATIGGKLEIIDIATTMKALGGKRLMIHSQAAILPFGNAIALSLAIAYAFEIGASRVALALHKDDSDESAEYTRGFIDQVEQLAAYGHDNSPTVWTPFLDMRKSGVFAMGQQLGVDQSLTWSCIRQGSKHCGNCGACRARRHAFVGIGVQDPTSYETEPVALESLAAVAV